MAPHYKIVVHLRSGQSHTLWCVDYAFVSNTLKSVTSGKRSRIDVAPEDIVMTHLRQTYWWERLFIRC